MAFVWSFNWIGERSSCEDVALSIFPACTQCVCGRAQTREGKDQWTGLVYWDKCFTVKHNVTEHEFKLLANVADSLLLFIFVTRSLSF